jgi:TolA-binding protein
MTDSADYPEDLVVRSRRGELSLEQRQRLGRLLESSSTLRLAQRVGLDFAAVGEVQPGDEHEVLACAGRVMRLRHGRLRAVRNAPRTVRWLLAAAVLVSTAGALGWWQLRAQPAPVRKAETETGVGWRSPPPRTAPPRRAAATSAVNAPVSADTTPQVAANIPAVDSGRTGRAPVPAQEAVRAEATGPALGVLPEAPADNEPLTAAGLLAQATSARGAGRPNEAIVLLQQLERQFPGSAEAELAHVSLGRLLLTSGRPAEALVEFSEYLGAGGPLAEEALLGQARAHAALGQAREERGAWEALLARYPRSVYLRQAKERLARLTAARTQ